MKLMSNLNDLIGTIEAEFGYNAGYVIALLDQFQADPAAVDPEWRSYFQRLTGDGNGNKAPVTVKTEEPARAEQPTRTDTPPTVAPPAPAPVAVQQAPVAVQETPAKG